jgi:site-specific DNA-methyltransferase (adenine-specific)
VVAGDNLLGMTALAAESPAVTLAYLDPPFFTGREHHRIQRSRDPKTGALSRASAPAFDDRWESLGDYLGALAVRVEAARRLLAPHGSLVLHVDPKTSHYARVLCDEIFGPECFASEIVWRYRRWPSKTKNFQRVHDVLLRYVRDPDAEPRFNQLYEPLAASTVATWGDRKQRAVTDTSGRRLRSSSTEEPSRGTPLGDVWEVSIVAPVAKERTGYPTQKPEALLERLLSACTDPGDLVLDPYMGSGTTLAVALRLGRRAIGLDSGAEALAVTRERLLAQGVEPVEQRVTPALAAARLRVSPGPRQASERAEEPPKERRRPRRRVA